MNCFIQNGNKKCYTEKPNEGYMVNKGQNRIINRLLADV